ncbi:MAG: LemA family protein [Candidatus Eisenbacteria bacterium]
MSLIILVGFAVVALVLVAGIYNGLVSLRNRAAASWADIEVQLKRRHDLVGNLVETVKGYAAHEQQTLEKVIDARGRAMGATGGGGPREAGLAENLLTSQLRSLFALAEAYPDLKANQNFQELQRSLESLETEIQNARRYYNAVVRDFNTKIQSVPDVLVARPLGFKERDYFELTDQAEGQVPKVQF